jgi:glycosyltransferase involved in cell wall biosynthesis
MGNTLEELPMVFVIPSYNNAQWYAKNLQSVLHQNYRNYRILYVNDASQDGTDTLVEGLLERENVDFVTVELECDPSQI